jgi:lipopolysaccharide/colanic/teichoic acid biosynthesis glycosyltransferase
VIDGRALNFLGDASLCRLAVERTAIGGPAVGLLAVLPPETAARRSEERPVGARSATPTSSNGHRNGNGHRPRSAGQVPAATTRASDHDLEAHMEMQLRQASTIVLPNRTTSYRVAKRALDILGASILLLITSPIIVVLALLIRLDSDGPAIFRQQRVTRGGRLFTFYKFRTMRVDARERFSQLYDYEFTGRDFSSSYYKLAEDPRNTRVGRWLRRTTLDELPNLFNVLKGDLSLVGPRPELPDLVPHYPPEHLACFFTKAGLTGLAQVAGRSLLTVDERLTLDTRYVANQTLLLDLRILARTVGAVVRGIGAF